MTLWKRWVAWLSAEEVGTSMALVRILIGTCVMHTILSVHLAGATQALWFDHEDGGSRKLGEGSLIIGWLGGPDPAVVHGMMALSVASAALVALGVGGEVLARVIAFVALQSFMALADLNGHAGGSYDELITNVLWLVVLAGPSRTLSWETWRSTGRVWSERTVMFWPRMLVVFQAVLMYATTGWQKLSVHWVPGGGFSALYYILQQPTWQRIDMRWVAHVYPLTQIGTAVSWFWEVLAPIWFFAWVASLPGGPVTRFGAWLVRWRVREVYLVIGVMFHLLVVMWMNIGPFSWASLALYPAFVHPGEWRAVAGKVRAWRGEGGG
jgi:hypothetical protein